MSDPLYAKDLLRLAAAANGDGSPGVAQLGRRQTSNSCP